MGNEGVLFEHRTTQDVFQMSHPTGIVLQFCDSEPADCPFPQPVWSHAGVQTGRAPPLWAARFEVQLVHTERTKLFSTATSHGVIVHKTDFLTNLIQMLNSRENRNCRQLPVDNGVSEHPF